MPLKNGVGKVATKFSHSQKVVLHCNVVTGGQVCIFDNLCCLIRL